MKYPRRLLGVLAGLVVIGSLVWPAAAAAEFVLEIEALIDGTDRLILKRDTLQWHHLFAAAVGRHHGANAPTIVFPYPGASEWFPEWSEPPPAEIRREELSSILSGLSPPLPTDGVPFAVQKIFGRGDTVIVQQPSAGNDFTLIVEFDDGGFAGPRYYGVVIAPDSDGDQTPDSADECPASDLSSTVVIGGCNTRVSNKPMGDGCNLADLIGDCARTARTHGEFVACVTNLTRKLKWAGLLTDREMFAIRRCAMRAKIP